MDPINVNDEETKEKKALLIDALHSVDERLTIHDFRMVPGPTHTNLVFDVLVPADYALSDLELKNCIQEKITQAAPNHFIVMKVDKDYVRQL